MIDSIQDTVESTAQELQCSIAVDDAGLRLLGYSSHFEDADEARLNSLVGRRVAGPLRDYVMGRGAQSWRDVTVLPACPELGLERDRTCFPLRSRYELLGFMWIISAKPLTQTQMEAARIGADRIRTILARRAQSAVDTDIETESLVFALLSSGEADRRQAARDVVDLGMFAGVTAFTAINITSPSVHETSFGEAPTSIVRRALSSATVSRRRETYAFAVSGEESVLILGSRGTADHDMVRTVAEGVLREIARLDADLARSTFIGIGSEQTSLEAINESFDQATVAARLAVTKQEPVVSWAQNPTDAVLSALLAPTFEERLIPGWLLELTTTQSAAMLEVIETYLDRAGNVIATADHLHLHRTTVYYRLRKFQQDTGLDIEDGSIRLLLHLWLRAQRFTSGT